MIQKYLVLTEDDAMRRKFWETVEGLGTVVAVAVLEDAMRKRLNFNPFLSVDVDSDILTHQGNPGSKRYYPITEGKIDLGVFYYDKESGR